MTRIRRACGAEAVDLAQRLTPIVRPWSGVSHPPRSVPVRLRKGQVIFRARPPIIFLGQAAGSAFYIRDNCLFQMSLGDFVEMNVDVIIGNEVVRMTKWMVPITRAFFTGVQSLVTAFLGPAGTIANLSVLLIKIGAWYAKNETAILRAASGLASISGSLQTLARSCPVTHAKIISALGNALRNAPSAAARGANLADGFAFFGSLLGNALRGPANPEAPIRSAALLVARIIGTVAIVRGPGAAARGTAEVAQDLIRNLRQDGVNINNEEARQIFDELRTSPDSRRELNSTLETFGTTSELIKDFSGLFNDREIRSLRVN